MDSQKIQNTKFRNTFLNNVGDIFERYGFGATKMFLLGKRESRDLRQQADALLRLIKKFEEYEEIKQNRSIGRYIIKILNTLKSLRTEVEK